jgi:hypothetical protein
MPFCDKETLQELIKSLSDEQIAKQFAVSAVSVQRLRLRYRILRKRTYSLDEDFFDCIDTPEKAYVLGFILADGYVAKEGKYASIIVTESDRKILEDIRVVMGSGAPIHTRYPGKGAYENSKPICRLDLCSMRLSSRLNELGLYHNKSLTATYPVIPDYLESHLIRGIFDGNGTISKHYFNIVGTPSLLQSIHDAFARYVSCSLTIKPHSRSPYVSVLRGNGAAAINAVQWMYTNPTLKLQRKYDKFLTYWL